MKAVTEREAMGEATALRVPPHSIEAEQSLLGGLLLDNRAWDRVCDLLTEQDFYRFEHRTIYAAVAAMLNAGKSADVITVNEQLKKGKGPEEWGGIGYLNSLAQSVASASNIRRYAEIVRERSMRRTLIAAGDQMASMAWQMGEEIGVVVEQTEALLAGLERRQVNKAPVPLSDLMIRAIDRYTELSEGKTTPGWSIGVPVLDRVLNGGLRPGKVYGIAARPSVGKSSLARAFGLATARDGHPTLLLSQEMPGDEVADCTVSALGGIESDRLQKGQFQDEDWTRMTEAVHEGSRLPLYIDDEGALTMPAIRAKARLVKGVQVVILDYLQLTSSTLKDANRNNQIEEVSRGLKALAMSMNVAVVVLSQLNRDVEKRQDKEPQLGDLRDSGAIEQDLDVAILLWTVKEFDGGARRIVGCKVAKHRGGPKGRFALEFKASTYRWYESSASLDMTRTEAMGKRSGGFDE
jgi:replicative DNA helicase